MLNLTVAIIAFVAGFLAGGNPVRFRAQGVSTGAGKYRSWNLSRLPKEPAPLGTAFSHSNTVAVAFSASDLFQHLKATRTDIETTSELQHRRAAGEYILRNEPPLMRRSQEWRFASLAAEASTNNSNEYSKVFSDLGITSSVSEELRTHLARIYRASLEMESAALQLVDARFYYDQRMRMLLDAEKYKWYQNYEESKTARRNLDALRNFLELSGCSWLDKPCEAALIRVMVEVRAVDEYSRGPYSPMPEVAVGREQIIALKEQRLMRQTESTRLLLTRLEELGLTPKQQAGFGLYYSKELDGLRHDIDNLRSHSSAVSPIVNSDDIKRLHRRGLTE